MKLYVDCPLCSVFMKQRSRSGSGEWSLVCPHCGSKFLINRDVQKRAIVMSGLASKLGLEDNEAIWPQIERLLEFQQTKGTK